MTTDTSADDATQPDLMMLKKDGTLIVRPSGAWPNMADLNKWQLTPILIRLVELARSGMRQAAQEIDDEWADRSARWQESEKGSEITDWAEHLTVTADTLDEIEVKPGHLEL